MNRVIKTWRMFKWIWNIGKKDKIRFCIIDIEPSTRKIRIQHFIAGTDYLFVQVAHNDSKLSSLIKRHLNYE